MMHLFQVSVKGCALTHGGAAEALFPEIAYVCFDILARYVLCAGNSPRAGSGAAKRSQTKALIRKPKTGQGHKETKRDTIGQGHKETERDDRGGHNMYYCLMMMHVWCMYFHHCDFFTESPALSKSCKQIL